MTNLTRRSFGIGAAGLTLAGLLPRSAFAQETRSVTSLLGTYDIPANPQRVICIDSRLDLEPAVALGLPVIAHAYWHPEPWVPVPDGVEFIGEIPNIEQILTLEPDLIICTSVGDLDSEYWPINRLKDVAPVLPAPYTLPFKEILALIGGWVGKDDAANAVLAEYDALVADLKARRGDLIASKTIVAIQPNADGTVYLQADPAFLQRQVMADLGARTLPVIEGNGVSAENFASAFAEVDGILLVNHGEGNVESIAQNPLWNRVPAVEAGAFIAPLGNTNYGGIYTAMQIVRFLDELYGKLA